MGAIIFHCCNLAIADSSKEETGCDRLKYNLSESNMNHSIEFSMKVTTFLILTIKLKEVHCKVLSYPISILVLTLMVLYCICIFCLC